MDNEFRTDLGRNVFYQKYAHGRNDTWAELAKRVVQDVCGVTAEHRRPLLNKDDQARLVDFITQFKFLPGGRYLYYAGRPAKFFNNCYLLRAEEDTREEWSEVTWRAMSCLMTGGGIGIDYSRLRPAGRPLSRTGGVASGPIPLMYAINEIGRNVMQGGSRRSAIYASLNWKHDDVRKFLRSKNWDPAIVALKAENFNFPAPLDMTNISVNYDSEWLEAYTNGDSWAHEVFWENVRQAVTTGEPGFSFNLANPNETLRNACTEVVSEDDSDVCNLGSVNFGAIDSLDELREVAELGAKFLACGLMRSALPYDKVYKVREQNSRIGLGIMGLHEWLLKRGLPYDSHSDLEKWLEEWKTSGIAGANEVCDRFYMPRPKGYFAVAPTGTIGILAGTTTGIEPLYAVAYKRRYLTEGTRWKYEYAVDGVAANLIDELGLKSPDEIETATDLAAAPARRIRFQSFVQGFVDQAISSTINLPAPDPKTVDEVVLTIGQRLIENAATLRGFTCYPDGSRGGQPITKIPYEDALKHKGVVFDENDICEITGHGGSCGV